ncbi:MAG TPA: TlpA disulfide reductase family protein [Gemmataceae bacterium]|jgi:thiol-disulfide isomerase/thioredoxin
MSTTARIAVGIFAMVFAGWLVFSSADAGAPSDGGGVELKTIKYPDLVKAVRDQRGKVIVVDLWGDFCVPCKREFPRLVELHRQYGDKGLVCMSVALDAPADPNVPAPPPGVLKFLLAKKATFANYWLNEDAQVWKRFGIEAVPAVFVFDRQGRRAAKFTQDFDYTDVRKLVEKLLAPPS